LAGYCHGSVLHAEFLSLIADSTCRATPSSVTRSDRKGLTLQENR
jgi:hypothetical protein